MADSGSRDDLLGFRGMCDQRTVVVRGRNYLVRGMTLGEFEALQKAALQAGDNASARVLASTLLNEDGSRMFKVAEADLLNELPLSVAQPLMEAVNELSGLSDSPEKQAALDEQLAGESEAQTSSS